MSTAEISAAFPFQSNYVEVNGSKMHYVDEGSGDPVLFLHGNPTSSYLWRNIIPYVSPHARVIAPDLIGMGRSDKPDIDYRFYDHAAYLDAFIEALDLRNITLVIHDWGSGLGFHYAHRNPDNVKAIAFMEALLMPTPSWDVFDEQAREFFENVRKPGVGEAMILEQNLFVEAILPTGALRKLTEEEMSIYRAPFTEQVHRKPTLQFPRDIPIAGTPADVNQTVMEYNTWLQATEIPKLLFYATPGALIPAPLVDWCKANLKNLKVVDAGAGTHFIQEDNPHLIGAELSAWYQAL